MSKLEHPSIGEFYKYRKPEENGILAGSSSAILINSRLDYGITISKIAI